MAWTGSYYSGKIYGKSNKYDGSIVDIFNDAATAEGCYVIGMKMFFRSHKLAGLYTGMTPTLAGIIVDYCNEKGTITSQSHGDVEPEGKIFQNFRLRQKESGSFDEEDKIAIVMLRSGVQIDQLEFRTRDGYVYGPYGGMGGDEHLESARDHGPNFEYLQYVSGVVANTEDGKNIIKFQLHWK